MTRHVFEIDVWPVFTGGHLQCQNKEFLSKTKIHCNLLHSAGAAVCKFSQVMVHTENWFTESVIRRKQLKNIYFYERVMAFPGWVVVFNGCWFEHNSIIDARPGNCSSRQFSVLWLWQWLWNLGLCFFYSWHSLSWFSWNEYIGCLVCLLAMEKLKVLTSGYIFQIEPMEQPLPFTFREEFITGEPREID